MSDVTREPFEWVEIDQDYCGEVYSVGSCTAFLASGGTECYNTRATCQDPANYDKQTLTLRFCKNQAFLPDDGLYYLPTLVNASISAGSINPVGAASTSSALGTRGGISIQFQDGPHTDRYVDPYIANRVSRDAGYIATERGTFWSKWRARNPYYVGRVVRHKTGFIENGAVVDVITRTYFITDFDGPSGSGQVSITGRDILSQFANDKAKAPGASAGKLLADLTDIAGTLTLDPVGISSEYPATGAIRIGSEIMTYTKGSGDVLNLTRAQYGTTAGAASAGDIVQLCLVYAAEKPADILEDLLLNYAGIPAGYLDTAQWATEQTDYMPRLYSTVISEPTGVQELIAEMCEQMYFYLVWDERAALLKLRAIRPAQDDTIYDLSDFRNFVSDSVNLRDLPEQLVTQVWVYYGLINYAASAKEEKNYAVREIVSTDEGQPDKQNLERIKKIYCRWIPSTNGAAAVDLGEKMIARYGAAPRQVSFTMTGKDSDVWIGDFVKVTHRLSVDATGAELPLNLQVMSSQQSKAGIEFRYVGQEFVFEAPVDPNDRLIIIAADQLNVNLRTLHDSIYAAPVGGENVRVIIRPGVVIGGRGATDKELYQGTIRRSYAFLNYDVETTLCAMMRRDISSASFYALGDTIAISASNNRVAPGTSGSVRYAMKSDLWEVPCPVSFDTGTWPSSVSINITAEAGSYIVGQSGSSSLHTAQGGGSISVVSGVGGLVIASDGGHAIRVQHPITFNNQGVIAGGGTSGFPVLVNGLLSANIPVYTHAPSGGGAGIYPVDAFTPDNANSITFTSAASGGALNAFGFGSRFSYQFGQINPFITGTAGNGGALASNGTAGSYTAMQAKYPERRVTAHPGYAIAEGASLITWTNKGDVRGPEVA